MEVVAFGAFLNTFMPKVWEVITAADGLREEIEEGIIYLQEELPSVDAYVREHGLQYASPNSEVTLISRACRLAEDIELCISRFLLYQTPKKKTHSRDHLKMSHLQFSRHIKEFRRRLDKIKEDLNQKKEELEGSAINSEEPKDPQWGVEEELAGVGMGVPCQELEELLEPTPPESDKGKLKVISIVGFGGSGKTRLAKQVYEHVGQQFDQKAWVSLAKRNINEVLVEILEKVSASTPTGVQHVDNGTGASTGVQQVDNGAGASTGIQKVNNGAGSSSRFRHVGSAAGYSKGIQQVDNRAGVSTGIEHINNGSASNQHVDTGASASTSVMEMLNSCLSKQRYLIVIDDVRSKDDWRNLQKSLPDSGASSRIIVTTTSQPVAELCSSTRGHVYRMSTLCDEDSQKLFLNASSKTLSPAHEKQLSTLLKTCDGLPLALIESAKPFKEGKEVSTSECHTTFRNLCVPESTNVGTLTRMQWVLMNKYSGLTSYGARACLLYFHMFPFENPTKGKFLTRRWLAEGLVQRDDANCSDLDAASNYLRIFGDSNIIRSMQASSNATVKSYTLPGTMHQFISRQCESQDFVTFLRHRDEPPKQKMNAIRRLSLHDSQVHGKDVKLNHLRSLAVSGKAGEGIIDFSKYEVLQVLDLKEWDFNQLDKGKKLQDKLQNKLKDICKLIMLKYLGLPDNIGEVPREIKDLKHLETLDVGGGEIVTVYGEVINLPALKHLLGKFCLYHRDTPKRYVPKDSILETFSGFVTNEKAAFPKLMKDMKKLKKVKMWCDFEVGRGELKHVEAAIKDFIFEGTTDPCDRSLSIDIKGCKVPFLESLETPGCLIKLKLHGTLEKVPEFITPEKVGGKQEWITPLDGLTKLCLSSTTLCEVTPLSSISHFPLQGDASLLPYLIYLKLVEDDLGPLNILKQHFKSLEQIYLVGKKTINSITIEAGALQHLVSLHVICEHLVGLAGIEIRGLINLKEITLDSKVNQTTKDAWKVAARGHPNKPQVFFIEAATKP